MREYDENSQVEAQSCRGYGNHYPHCRYSPFLLPFLFPINRNRHYGDRYHGGGYHGGGHHGGGHHGNRHQGRRYW